MHCPLHFVCKHWREVNKHRIVVGADQNLHLWLLPSKLHLLYQFSCWALCKYIYAHQSSWQSSLLTFIHWMHYIVIGIHCAWREQTTKKNINNGDWIKLTQLWDIWIAGRKYSIHKWMLHTLIKWPHISTLILAYKVLRITGNRWVKQCRTLNAFANVLYQIYKLYYIVNERSTKSCVCHF